MPIESLPVAAGLGVLVGSLAAFLANKSIATFAHAIASTSPTIPISTESGRW